MKIYRNKKREENNLAILTLLKQGKFTKDILKKYTGWGGLKNSFHDVNIKRKLEKILSNQEIEILRKTFRNAHYTPKYLIDFIYSGIQEHNHKIQHILEPAIGIGAFIEYMPVYLRNNSNIIGVDIDNIAIEIAKILYPDIILFNRGFEIFHPKRKYDLIVGNPPFGNRDWVQDPRHSDLSHFLIHNFFVAKAMRLLEKNGILGIILPSFFMDNIVSTRKIIQDEGGYLISAFRFMDNLFDDTIVPVDIIFLGKKKTKHLWLSSQKTTLNNTSKMVNQYFITNPQHIFDNQKAIIFPGLSY